MEILILICLVVVHCIYIPLAVHATKNASINDLSGVLIEKYVACLFWPAIAAAGILFAIYTCIVYGMFVGNKLLEKIEEAYWDVSMFYAYISSR